MKSIVIYSSLTGNTKQVAESITSVLPAGTPCVSMKELPSDLSSYDLVFAGFWVDKGTANKEARDVLGTLHNPYIALFATAGVPPQMAHAKAIIRFVFSTDKGSKWPSRFLIIISITVPLES